MGVLEGMFEVEQVPLATASIAQVVKGVDHQGKSVIIKLQRPNIHVTFQQDIGDLETVLGGFKSVGLASADKILTTIQECKPAIFEELDFKQEALNMQRFKSSLADIPWVAVPDVIRVGSKHIVMDYVPGIKVTDTARIDAAGIDRKDLAKRLMMTFIVQILRNGIFHADQHPGNIAVRENGDIVYYDFGSVIYIQEYREYLGKLIQSLVLKDVGLMIECLVNMKIITPKGSKIAIKRVFTKFIDFISNMDAKEFHVSIAETQSSIRTSSKDSFALDVRFIYMIKTANMLEGICRTLDPDFSYDSFFGEIQDILPEVPKLQQTLLQDIVNVPSSVKNMSDIISDMEEIQIDMGYDIQKLQDFIKLGFGIWFLSQFLF